MGLIGRIIDNIQNFKYSVFAVSISVFIIILISIGWIVNLATNAADRFALKTQLKMIEREINNLSEISVREQAEISYWTPAYDKLATSKIIDKEFAKDEIQDWVIADFGFSDVMMIDQFDHQKLHVSQKEISESQTLHHWLHQNMDVIIAAKASYKSAVNKSETGYFLESKKGLAHPDIAETAFRFIDEKPYLIVAQVMLPDKIDLSTNQMESNILVSFKPITDELITKLETELDLINLRFKHVDNGFKNPVQFTLPNLDQAKSSISLRWIPRAPRPAILRNILPLAVVIGLLLFFGVIAIVTLYKNALQKLSDSEAESRYKADHDMLTKLPNRAHFNRRLDGFLENPDEKQFALLFIDLDKFKAINDDYGHEAGDIVLKEVAQRFRNRLEGRGLVARLGGDEFVALIDDIANGNELEWIAENLVSDACEPIYSKAAILQIGASIGIAISKRDGHTARELMNAGDEALYKAKQSGRARVEFYGEKSMSKKVA